jgi:hypothetical protein
MNGTRISEFQSATPLSGGEVFPILQSGVNRITTVESLSTVITPKTSVFITDIVNNTGLVQKQYKPDTIPVNYVIDSVVVDTNNNLAVTFEWDGPASQWTGVPTINGQQVSNSAISRISDTRRFKATQTVNLQASNKDDIVVEVDSGTAVVSVDLLGGGPEITRVSFGSPPTTKGYQPPFFIDGDPVQVTVEFDVSDVGTIELYSGNSYATVSEVKSVTVTGTSPPSATFTTVVDCNDSNITQLPLKISAKNSFGTKGPDYTSTSKIAAKKSASITNVSLGSYPGTQTELKDGDQIQATFEFDTNDVSTVRMLGGNSFASGNENRSVSTNQLSATTNITIDTSVTTATTLPVKAQPRSGHGQYGTNYTSSDTLVVNNAYPTYTQWNVTYPVNQQAIKSTETAIVNLLITKTGGTPTYTYSSTTGEVQIPEVNNYSLTKTVSCTNPGTYNINNNNFRVTVNRAENDATSTFNNRVNIVDKLPTINISHPGSRLRSGGNDGTTVQTYQITVQSDQRLMSFTMNEAPSGGTLDGSWQSSSNNTRWTRNLKVSDDDGKGEFNWVGMTATNMANVVQNNINSGETYKLGGFVTRTLPIASQGWQSQANVQAVTYNKVNVTWTQKNLTTRANVGDVSRPQIATWSLDRLSPSPITVNILDSGSTNASSTPTTITVEEVE